MVSREEVATTLSLPPFATGEIAGSYELLYIYWKKAGRRAEEAVLREEDFEVLRHAVEREGLRRLDDLLERLTDHFVERIDPEAAREAVREYYGSDVDPEAAKRAIARLLASWLLEAGKEWKMYRFQGFLPRD